MREGRYSNTNLMCPSYKREKEGGRSFAVSSAKLWNNIPLPIRKKETVKNFKTALHQYFIDKYSNIDSFEHLI